MLALVLVLVLVLGYGAVAASPVGKRSDIEVALATGSTFTGLDTVVLSDLGAAPNCEPLLEDCVAEGGLHRVTPGSTDERANKEDTMSTGETGFDDVSFDLISLQYHSLKAGHDYGRYVREALDAGQEKIAPFFVRVMSQDSERAHRCHEFLAQLGGTDNTSPRDERICTRTRASSSGQGVSMIVEPGLPRWIDNTIDPCSTAKGVFGAAQATVAPAKVSTESLINRLFNGGHARAAHTSVLRPESL